MKKLANDSPNTGVMSEHILKLSETTLLIIQPNERSQCAVQSGGFVTISSELFRKAFCAIPLDTELIAEKPKPLMISATTQTTKGKKSAMKLCPPGREMAIQVVPNDLKNNICMSTQTECLADNRKDKENSKCFIQKRSVFVQTDSEATEKEVQTNKINLSREESTSTYAGKILKEEITNVSYTSNANDVPFPKSRNCSLEGKELPSKIKVIVNPSLIGKKSNRTSEFTSQAGPNDSATTECGTAIQRSTSTDSTTSSTSFQGDEDELKNVLNSVRQRVKDISLSYYLKNGHDKPTGMEYMYAHMSLLKDFIRNCKGTLPAIRHLLYRYIGHLTKITNKFCSEKAASVIEFDSQVISYIRLHGMWTFNRAGKQATDDLMKKNNLQNKLNPSDVKAFHAYVAGVREAYSCNLKNESTPNNHTPTLAGERSATQPRERPPRSASSYKRAPVSNFSRSSPTKRRRSSQSPSHDLRDQITKYTPDENRYPANHRIFNNQPLPMGQNYRPKYCDFFNKTGSCKHGTRCQYVHACANCNSPVHYALACHRIYPSGPRNY